MTRTLRVAMSETRNAYPGMPATVGELKVLADPSLCRPSRCGRADCGSTRLYVHGRRERHPKQLVEGGEPVPTVEILVFLCAECGATWRVLPLFLARCLRTSCNLGSGRF